MKCKTSVVDIHKVKGIRPEYDVYVGRAVNRGTEFTEDSKWANPFSSRFAMKRVPKSMIFRFYEEYVREVLWDDLEELKGKRLGDWCITTDKIEPLVCHAQVLLKLLREKENESK